MLEAKNLNSIAPRELQVIDIPVKNSGDQPRKMEEGCSDYQIKKIRQGDVFGGDESIQPGRPGNRSTAFR